MTCSFPVPVARRCGHQPDERRDGEGERKKERKGEIPAVAITSEKATRLRGGRILVNRAEAPGHPCSGLWWVAELRGWRAKSHSWLRAVALIASTRASATPGSRHAILVIARVAYRADRVGWPRAARDRPCDRRGQSAKVSWARDTGSDVRSGLIATDFSLTAPRQFSAFAFAFAFFARARPFGGEMDRGGDPT